MISRRTEALLAIREAGGEGANILKKVDRMLSAERFRADNRAAKRLRMLAEDAVLGYYGREDEPKGTDHTLGKALRLYAEHEGARDSIRILLDPDARHLLIERMKPRLFVSHLHMDEPLAAALVNVIEATFEVTRPDIRATSVRPYRLTVGERPHDRLRDEIETAEAVMGMIAPDTRESDYVLFELAAAWSHRRLICPLLVRGARSADIPEPIRDRHSLRISDPRDCHELLDELERSTSLQRKRGVGGDVSDKVHRLVELASIIR